MKISGQYGEKITPGMFGLFFEDINFAADGGLYAEMIENRSFEAKRAAGQYGAFYATEDCGYAWSAVAAEGEKEPQMLYVTGTPVSEVNPHYLRLTTYAPDQGFANQAYDGICLQKGERYKVSFYARCVRFEGENFGISIRKDGVTYAETRVTAKKAIPYVIFTDLGYDMPIDNPEAAAKAEQLKGLDKTNRIRQNDWYHYEAVLTAEESVRGAEFVVTMDAPGIAEFDLVSMIPENAVAGIFRRDLFDALKDIHPGFIRFPGGCIVEGISLENRYRWKNTVGELKDRKYIPNLWAFEDDGTKQGDMDGVTHYCHYGQSYGLGFYEFFLLCELLGAKPLPVLGIGTACQFRTTQMVSSDSEEFCEFVQDALDLIEFANGGIDTPWGGLRARMGHPEPFGMDMLAIGNEQWQTQHLDFYERYSRFASAIHAVCPDMKLLGSAGPGVENPPYEKAWEFYRREGKLDPSFCYAVDEHYYVAPEWLYGKADFYDNYPREVSVFAGEYAAHTQNRENNMVSALAEASFLTGVEKNAGVVKLASYAPLFNRIGHSQWKPDMIWFDDCRVYLTPNYYVQKLFANHVGDHTLAMDGQEKLLRQEGIYVSLTQTAEGERILKVTNTGDDSYVLPLEEDGAPVCANARVWTLTADGEAPEGMPQPSRVAESRVEIRGSISLVPGSFSVIRF